MTTVTTEILRIIRDYYNQLNANKMDNLEEMDKFLETLELLKTEPGKKNRKYEQTNQRTEIETVIKKTF